VFDRLVGATANSSPSGGNARGIAVNSRRRIAMVTIRDSTG